MLFCAEQSWDTMDWKAKLNELEVKIWERNPLKSVVDIQDSFSDLNSITKCRYY